MFSRIKTNARFSISAAHPVLSIQYHPSTIVSFVGAAFELNWIIGMDAQYCQTWDVGALFNCQPQTFKISD
jgi:uncharacterized protein with beta-barrel porin domain